MNIKRLSACSLLRFYVVACCVTLALLFPTGLQPLERASTVLSPPQGPTSILIPQDILEIKKASSSQKERSVELSLKQINNRLRMEGKEESLRELRRVRRNSLLAKEHKACVVDVVMSDEWQGRDESLYVAWPRKESASNVL